jgi:hypothetical protein
MTTTDTRTTWQTPPEPGPEVTQIRDSQGGLWTRHTDNNWRHLAARRTWPNLLAEWGPLTDATPTTNTKHAP